MAVPQAWRNEFSQFVQQLADTHRQHLLGPAASILDGEDQISVSLRSEAEKLVPSTSSQTELWNQFELLCIADRTLRDTTEGPSPKQTDPHVEPEHHPGTPTWELLIAQIPVRGVFPTGYLYLITRFQLPSLDNHLLSVVYPEHDRDDELINTPERIWRCFSDPDYFDRDAFYHLRYALEYEDVNLGILWFYFNSPQFNVDEFALSLVNGDMDPTTRRLWFWYEFLTSLTLNIPPVPVTVTPAPLLDPDMYSPPPPNYLSDMASFLTSSARLRFVPSFAKGITFRRAEI
jgi:hypothetical protein